MCPQLTTYPRKGTNRRMLINGKEIANRILEELKIHIQQLSTRPPCLAVIIVGNHPASRMMVRRKIEACQTINMLSVKWELPASISESELVAKVNELNDNPMIDGILVQLPLPPHIDPTHITHCIYPEKDVDGFHPFNVGRMLRGETEGFLSCTPLGIQTLFERCGIDVCGKHVLVIGRSNIVGKPIAALLLQDCNRGNATVTIAHRYTKNLKQLSLLADIIIVAIGQPKFLTADMIKEGAVVIDVGINKIDDSTKKSGYQIVGDVDFENVAPKCSFITPVPGGVGPMTIAMLLQNTFLSYKKKHETS